MSLLPSLLLAPVSTLAEARFASAIGIGYMAVDADPDRAKALSTKEIKDLTGWAPDPNLIIVYSSEPTKAKVVEIWNTVTPAHIWFDFNATQALITTMTEFWPLVTIQVPSGSNLGTLCGLLKTLPDGAVGCILHLNGDSSSLSSEGYGEELVWIRAWMNLYPTWVRFENLPLDPSLVLDLLHPVGLSLSPEVHMGTGLQDFGNILDVLEKLGEDL